MNQKEFESVIKQPPNIRYEYFIKKVADYEEVWGLYDDGWATAQDDDGNILIPFFPKKELQNAVPLMSGINSKLNQLTYMRLLTNGLLV
jgi:hypothetical protein